MATVDLIEQVESVPSSVDTEAGKLFDVKLVGLNSPSKNRRYDEAALRRAIGLYEGVRVNINHQSPAERGQPRRFEDRIGRVSGVYFKEGDGLYARELTYNKAHPWADSLKWWSENDSRGVGLSQAAVGDTRTVDGVQVVEEIRSVYSVDLVGEASTTQGLYESKGADEMDLAKLTSAELKEARPDLVEAFLEEAKTAGGLDALKKENAELKEALAGYREKEEADKRRAAVIAMCEEAKLPKEAVTDVFVEALVSVDESFRAKLIEDRLSTFGKAPERPVSEERSRENPEGLNEGWTVDFDPDKVLASMR